MVCGDLEQEGENELYTLNELYDKMITCRSNQGIDSDSMYTKDYLKTLLQKRYSDHIYFAQQPGREDLSGFRGFCDLLLRNQLLSSRRDEQDSEAEKMVRKAAQFAKLGLSISSHETLRFKYSVMQALPQTAGPGSAFHMDTEDSVSEPIPLTQYIADNFDHNIRIIDGLGTLHGMGVILAT